MAKPAQGDAGEVALVRSFSVSGRPCHLLRYEIRFAAQPDPPRVLSHDWRRMSDQTWKIVETER